MSYRDVLLISEETIKENSLLSDNVDTKYITPIIKAVQDTRLLPLLGQELYVEIRTQVDEDDLSGDNKTLLDYYITDYLIWAVLNEIQIPLSNKFKNAGMTTSSNSDFQPMQYSDMKNNSNYYRAFENFYQAQIVKFLMDNNSLYPLYKYYNDDFDSEINF